MQKQTHDKIHNLEKAVSRIENNVDFSRCINYGWHVIIVLITQ